METTEDDFDFEWHRDPAASGWRSRAFMGSMWEILVYDDGGWEVRGPPLGHALTFGWVELPEAAFQRSISAYRSLRRDAGDKTCVRCCKPAKWFHHGVGWTCNGLNVCEGGESHVWERSGGIRR